MSPTIKIDISKAGDSQQNDLKKSLEEKKALLKNQIQELKRLKYEIKQTLNTSTFISEKSRNRFSQTNDLEENQVQKLQNDYFSIKNELFNFAGIQCVKFSKDEYIFHFVAKGEGNKSYIYSVQFFKIDNKGELGKWTMPTFIDINWILKETPLDNIVYAVQFVRNCKHYIDCYHIRMNQFVTLKKSLSNITNCTLDADQSYKYINIELFGVYDVESESHINIIIYLLYDLKETRPQQIKIDSLHREPLDSEKEKGLKNYLKSFKKLSLTEAFEDIENGENPLFSWQRLEKDQTILDPQDSDEDIVSEEIAPQQRKRRRINSRKKNSPEKELKQKSKRGKVVKRKILPTSEETEEESKHKKRPKKSKFHAVRKRKPVVKKGLIQKAKGRIKAKPKKVDISRFLTKKDQNKPAPEQKDSNQPDKEESELEIPPEESQSLEKKTKKPTIEIIQPCRVDLTLDSNIEVLKKLNLKNARQVGLMLEKISEHETSGEGRVLRSDKNSSTKNDSPKEVRFPREATPKKVSSPEKTTPKKVGSPKKIPLKKEVPPRKPVSPKKIVLSRKLASFRKATSSETTISSKADETKTKQSNLKIPYPSENSSSTETATIKFDYKAKMLKSKVVTSTPMPLHRKVSKQPFEDDLNISEIQSNENGQAAKTQIKRSVLERKQEIHLTRKIATKSGIKKASQVKK